jgi:hypothetical protein
MANQLRRGHGWPTSGFRSQGDPWADTTTARRLTLTVLGILGRRVGETDGDL